LQERRPLCRPLTLCFFQGDLVAFFVDIQTDALMMGFHELASLGLFELRLYNHVARHHFGVATHENNRGKLFPLAARTPAAFTFTQP
jgi:hypothetical protein